MSLVHATRELVAELQALEFAPPVACVYNPLDYAWDMHRAWLERFGRGVKEIMLVGMNPGPFGMVQTGVPFGEVEAVRSWLGLRGEVHHPRHEHAKRPVQGLECTRSEVSGRRLWSYLATRCVTPQRFARRFFVHNYCPLAFVSETGANLTPDKLPRHERDPLFRLCDRYLLQVTEIVKPKLLVGVGAFAAERAADVLAGRGVRIGRIPHPSPASPAANRGWDELADAAFAELGVAI